jgi:DNA-binding LytR/AlgR family response regulator
VRMIGGEMIALDWGATTEVLMCRDVLFARSMGNHTQIVARGRTLKVHFPLKKIVTALGPVGLVQVRRDVAVAAVWVRRLVGNGGHRLVVELDGGVQIAVGRQFQRDIRARFSSKHGSAK